jgi:lysophospholipase L1-like esterase
MPHEKNPAVKMKKTLIFITVYLCLSGCSKDEITWTAIGDSITYLNEHADETGSRITKGYMTRVTEKLPNIHYVNKGYNGWTAGDIAREIDNLELEKSDLYTVFLGTNDWWQGRPIGTIDDYKSNAGNETFFGSFRIIIDKLKDLNADARIILLTPMQRVDFVYIGDMKNNAYGSYKEKNNQALADFAEAILAIGLLDNLRVVDLYNDSGMTHESLMRYKRLKDPETGTYKNYPYPDFIDIPFNPLTDEYPYPVESVDMTYDGLHPSDKGYAVIADMLVEVIK